MTKTDRTGRHLRADALRNRERLMEEAKTAFTEQGPDVSLEEIARRAEVGIGTLYRHFPNRQAILEAVYRREIEQLGAAADRLLRELPPAEAMRQWLRLSIDYMATKKVIAAAFTAAVGNPSALYEFSGNLLAESIETLLAAAIAAGDVRPDVKTADIMAVMMGVAATTSAPDWRESAVRLTDILIAGLQSKPS
ncbi:TetR/AcrR family transcriptional regulator [Consotaella aegiceratis]|uniref:TetR/AcrR family transcriptional regulator n=1 Tax=Consotaella aegiceratis TaxID=3097961 RepID=UPI002F41CD89